MGIVVNALLVVNNYRDRDNDARCGKRTLIVLLGEPFGRYFYLANGLIATAFVDFWFAFENNKIGILLMIIYIVKHLIVWKKLCIIREGKALNKLIGQTSLNMLIFALLTTLEYVCRNRGGAKNLHHKQSGMLLLQKPSCQIQEEFLSMATNQ